MLIGIITLILSIILVNGFAIYKSKNHEKPPEKLFFINGIVGFGLLPLNLVVIVIAIPLGLVNGPPSAANSSFDNLIILLAGALVLTTVISLYALLRYFYKNRYRQKNS